jgi:hypothetical protein
MSARRHALTVEWSGQYGPESSSTGTCRCGGWSESASSQRVVRDEYRHHLAQVAKQEAAPERPTAEIVKAARSGSWTPASTTKHTFERSGDNGDRCAECGNDLAWHPRSWR